MMDESHVRSQFEILVDRHKSQWALLGIEAHHPNCLCVRCVSGHMIDAKHPECCGCTHCTGWYYPRSLNHPFFSLIDKILTLQNEVEAKRIEIGIKNEQIKVLETHIGNNKQEVSEKIE